MNTMAGRFLQSSTTTTISLTVWYRYHYYYEHLQALRPSVFFHWSKLCSKLCFMSLEDTNATECRSSNYNRLENTTHQNIISITLRWNHYSEWKTPHPPHPPHPPPLRGDEALHSHFITTMVTKPFIHTS
jgi:hypothetical protein